MSCGCSKYNSQDLSKKVQLTGKINHAISYVSHYMPCWTFVSIIYHDIVAMEAPEIILALIITNLLHIYFEIIVLNILYLLS